jgi:hypothetical protein
LKEISFKTFDGGELLADLHQIACRTQLCLARQLLERALRLVPSSNLMIVRNKSSSPLVLDDFAVEYPGSRLMRLRIDSWTGKYVIAFRKLARSDLLSGNSDDLDLEMYPTAGQVTTVVFLALWNVLTSATTVGMYGSPALGMTVTIDLYHIRFLGTYSFAPDFAMLLQASFGHPTVSIVDKNGLSFSKPEVAELDCVPTSRARLLPEKVLWSTKRYVFLAQTQRYLADFDIKSVVIGESLSVDIPFCSSCILNCDLFLWELVGVLSV